MDSGTGVWYQFKFQSTPSLRKVTISEIRLSIFNNISIHTFLTEGDGRKKMTASSIGTFQSTPSLRKVTFSPAIESDVKVISIHTFLTEGDQQQATKVHPQQYFNPHLPYGRWRNCQVLEQLLVIFQSTPSLRKVTEKKFWINTRLDYFNPHLPYGRWRRK